MPSKEMEMVKAGMKMMMEKGFAPRFDGTLDPIQLRTIVQAAQSQMQKNPDVLFAKCNLGGIEAEMAIPQNKHDGVLILYIHGGGFLCGNAQTSRGFAGMLAAESGFPVYSISYRLAPENKFPAAPDDCYAAYRALLKQHPHESICLIGESAGACLCLVTALRARDEQERLPNGIVLYSPPIDFSGMLNRSFPGNKDFTVTPEAIRWMSALYCDRQDQRHPYVSPYYADFAGLCPVFLAWDENESLSVDAKILREKAISAGVEIGWKSFPDCFHAFATTGKGTPESSAVLTDSIAFINKHANGAYA